MSSDEICVVDNKISKNNCKLVGIILDRIVRPSDPEVLVDLVSDLSSTKETVLFLDFLFLQTDLFFLKRVL